jgi:hypothetical protein
LARYPAAAAALDQHVIAEDGRFVCARADNMSIDANHEDASAASRAGISNRNRTDDPSRP